MITIIYKSNSKSRCKLTHAHAFLCKHTQAHMHARTLSLSLSLTHTHTHTNTHKQPGQLKPWLHLSSVDMWSGINQWSCHHLLQEKRLCIPTCHPPSGLPLLSISSNIQYLSLPRTRTEPGPAQRSLARPAIQTKQERAMPTNALPAQCMHNRRSFTNS